MLKERGRNATAIWKAWLTCALSFSAQNVLAFSKGCAGGVSCYSPCPNELHLGSASSREFWLCRKGWEPLQLPLEKSHCSPLGRKGPSELLLHRKRFACTALFTGLCSSSACSVFSGFQLFGWSGITNGTCNLPQKGCCLNSFFLSYLRKKKRKRKKKERKKKFLFLNFNWIGVYPLGIQCIWVSSGCLYIFPFFPLSFK